MRQPHHPPLSNTTLQIFITPKTEPLVVVYAYVKRLRKCIALAG